MELDRDSRKRSLGIKSIERYIHRTQISYAHLPAHLMPCFLLCSMYPKDHMLEKMDLIELWISHGYIKSRGKKSVTEIGIEYCEELIKRSFLNDFSDMWSKKCKLHDVIHDLARLNSEKEHCSVEINQIHDTIGTQEVYIPQEVCHLYIGGFVICANEVLQQNLKGLRTLSANLQGCKGYSEHRYCINSKEIKGLKQVLENSIFCMENTVIFNLAKFEPLRLLELKGDHLKEIPDSIAELKHLCHLRITSEHLQTLPSSIGLLYNLQTFILDCAKSPLMHLPESIEYLANLRYLCIDCKVEEIPRSFFLLTNLQRLIIKSKHLQEVPSDIGSLHFLEELSIYSEQIQALPDSIGHLNRLMKLDLYVGNSFKEVPTAILQKLNILRIRSSYSYNYYGTKNFPVVDRNLDLLKDMNSLEGEILIERLDNITNLVDAQNASLRCKHKIRSLCLSWHYYYIFAPKGLTISIQKEESGTNRGIGGDMDVGLLECLQPHPHLKKLAIEGYPSEVVPDWMGNPFSLWAIQEIILQGCKGIQSLPFRYLHTLKHLQVCSCSSIRIMPLEVLPSKIEELNVSLCKELELVTGIRNLKEMAALEIRYCDVLKSITMEAQQLEETTETFGNSTHDRPRHGQQGFSSLRRLKIKDCSLLLAIPLELVQPCPPYVRVHRCGCPDLEVGYV